MLAALIVNVASKCGLTPQYEGLERLYESLSGRGFSVLGVPCNQFGGQEPGSAEEIEKFCSTTYGVTFPMFAKVDVNGPDAHPLWAWLRDQRSGRRGSDIDWNFTKFSEWILSPEYVERPWRGWKSRWLVTPPGEATYGLGNEAPGDPRRASAKTRMGVLSPARVSDIMSSSGSRTTITVTAAIRPPDERPPAHNLPRGFPDRARALFGGAGDADDWSGGAG